MVEAALYILTGLTVYGGGHHLYLGINRTLAAPHLRIGGLYLLLSAFAFSSALTYQQPNLEMLLPAGKLAVSLGIILWASLVWHIAFRTDYKPLLLLDALTAVWAIFLVRNLTSPNSLLYADVTPVKQTRLSGETVDLLFTNISPWWTAVELTMLASLLFCLYACYRLYLRGPKALALVNATGLVLLGLVTLFDHFVSIQLIQAGYLTPFGFLLFLLPGSLYPLLQDWRKQRRSRQVPVYNLPYMPDQASFHSDISQLHTPFREGPIKTHLRTTTKRETPQESVSAHMKTVARGSAPDSDKEPPSEAAGAAAMGAANAQKRSKKTTGTGITVEPAPQLDTAKLHTISDNLIDIAVYATMALNRFKRGDADPQTLTALCKKVRSQAIKTRRLANELVRPEQTEDKQEPSARNRP
jgi:hypothetical protein